MLRRVETPAQELNIVGAYDSINSRLARIGAANMVMLKAMRAQLSNASASSDWQLQADDAAAAYGYPEDAGGSFDSDASNEVAHALGSRRPLGDSLVLGPLSPGLALGWEPRAPGTPVENPHPEFYGIDQYGRNIDQ